MELHKVFYIRHDSAGSPVQHQTRHVGNDRQVAIDFATELANHLKLKFNSSEEQVGTEDVYSWMTYCPTDADEIVIYQLVKADEE